MDNDIFSKSTGTWYETAQKEEKKPTLWPLAAGIGGVALMGLAYIAGFAGGSAPVGQLRRQTLVLSRQVQIQQRQEQALLAGRHCRTFDRQIGELNRLIAAGSPGIAASLAVLYVQDTARPACPQTRLQLAELAYTARLDALFARPPAGPLDHTPLLTWLSAEQAADQAGVPAADRLSPLTVAVQAYNAHLWELARAAFLRAWREQLTGPADVDQVNFYYALLRNYGHALTQSGDGEAHTEGLTLLRTADAISQHYGLGRGEAARDLQQLAGRHAALPAPDRSDPVLAGGQK